MPAKKMAKTRPVAKKSARAASTGKTRVLPSKSTSPVTRKKLVPPKTSRTASAAVGDQMEGMGAGVYLAQKGKLVWANPLFQKMTGFSEEELTGIMLLDHVHPEDRDETRNNAVQSLKRNSLDTYLYRFIRKNGEIAWFLETVNPTVHQGTRATLGSVMDITRYQKERESQCLMEDRYRSILEEIEEGYGELDLKGNYIFVNEAAAANIGYTPAEMIGTNFRKYVDADTASKLQSVYGDVFATGQRVQRVEVPFISKSGLTRFVEVSGTLILDPQGKPIGFRGISRDVTERRWTEEALLQSEARYFSIIESIGEAYFESELGGLITYVNDKVCEDLGYTRNEMLALSYRDFQDAENAKKTFDAFNRVYESGQPCHAYSYEAIRKDGTRAVFELSISLMRDAEGDPIGFRGLSRNITERKRMEDALMASEERARTIIATIPDPYFETDLKGRFTYINEAFERNIGLATMDYRAYMDKETASRIFTLYNAVYKTGMTMKNAEMEINIRDGETRTMNMSVSLIRDPQGEPAGFHGIMRDVTESKAAQALMIESEKMLREYSESLEARVRERTAELEKAKIAAESASRAKSDFLANISHEFQTPLNSIIGFTKVLNDRLFGDLNDKQEEFIRYISEAGELLSRLLTEIIDVSNLSSGRVKVDVSPVSITQVLSRVTGLLSPHIAAKNQMIHVDVALDADVSIEADDEKVRHIFFHLLSNAVKYTPEGGRIGVSAKRARSVTGRDGVAVSVSDTGVGIKTEDLPRLFESFGRLESSYSRETSGIGVGLSLTKKLVELHGGTISVESEYGAGSRFTVFLPLKHSSGSNSE